MDDQQEQRVNEAADQFTSAVVDSYRAISERGVSAQEQNAQLTEDFFNRVVNNLRTQAEQNREMTQQLADRQQRRVEAAQTLTQESANVYLDFLNSGFADMQQGAEAEKRGAREAEKGAKGQKS